MGEKDIHYKKIATPLIPKSEQGKCLVDLYVYLPKRGKFIVASRSGDSIDPAKVDKLMEHPVPHFFYNPSDAFNDGFYSGGDRKDIQLLTPTGQQELVQLINKIKKSGRNGQAGTYLQELEGYADRLVDLLAPVTENLRAALLNNSRYVTIMNDASAQMIIAILVAFCNGFTTRKTFKEIIVASILMDIFLADVGERTLKKYYTDHHRLTDSEWAAIRQHPLKAHEFVIQTLPEVSENIHHFVLNQHELKNGDGYPSGVRSQTLSPLMQCFALAVDAFEFMKRSETDTLGPPMDLVGTFKQLKEPGVPAHRKRHLEKWIDNVIAVVG